MRQIFARFEMFFYARRSWPFWRRFPSLKEFIFLLSPSTKLMKRFWPAWDPEDRHLNRAPKAGYYNPDTGCVYDHNHKYVTTVRR